MLNGLLKMRRYVLGVRRQCRDRWDVTSWPVNVVKVSVICVRNLGNPITKIISNVTYTSKNLMSSLVVRNK
jgi:hypothetical protein